MFEIPLWEFFLKYEDQIVRLLLNALIAVIIFAIGFYISKLFSKLLNVILCHRRVDPMLVGFSSSLVKYSIIALTVIMVLGRLGLETTSFVAIIGAAGLAIGLSLQGALGNFAAGVLLILFRPFKVGDLIDVGIRGTVESVQIFSTHLTLKDGRIVVVPNGKIVANNIINYSCDPYRRIDLIIGVGYDSNTAKVKEVLRASVWRTENILRDEPVVVRVEDLAASSVNFLVRAWSKNADYNDCRATLLENIKNDLDCNGITIPFTTYEVHLKQNELSVASEKTP